jgi:hypothetical protein
MCICVCLYICAIVSLLVAHRTKSRLVFRVYLCADAYVCAYVFGPVLGYLSVRSTFRIQKLDLLVMYASIKSQIVLDLFFTNHTCICIYNKHTYIHTYIHTCTYIYAHTHTHTHTNTTVSDSEFKQTLNRDYAKDQIDLCYGGTLQRDRFLFPLPPHAAPEASKQHANIMDSTNAAAISAPPSSKQGSEQNDCASPPQNVYVPRRVSSGSERGEDARTPSPCSGAASHINSYAGRESISPSDNVQTGRRQRTRGSATKSPPPALHAIPCLRALSPLPTDEEEEALHTSTHSYSSAGPLKTVKFVGDVCSSSGHVASAVSQWSVHNVSNSENGARASNSHASAKAGDMCGGIGQVSNLVTDSTRGERMVSAKSGSERVGSIALQSMHVHSYNREHGSHDHANLDNSLPSAFTKHHSNHDQERTVVSASSTVSTTGVVNHSRSSKGAHVISREHDTHVNHVMPAQGSIFAALCRQDDGGKGAVGGSTEGHVWAELRWQGNALCMALWGAAIANVSGKLFGGGDQQQQSLLAALTSTFAVVTTAFAAYAYITNSAKGARIRGLGACCGDDSSMSVSSDDGACSAIRCAPMTPKKTEAASRKSGSGITPSTDKCERDQGMSSTKITHVKSTPDKSTLTSGSLKEEGDAVRFQPKEGTPSKSHNDQKVWAHSPPAVFDYIDKTMLFAHEDHCEADKDETSASKAAEVLSTTKGDSPSKSMGTPSKSQPAIMCDSMDG